jgi:hypothetical protein
MKQLKLMYRRSLLANALHSGMMISLLAYVVMRGLFYEFPMSWKEEFVFLGKTVITGTFMIASATAGSILLYRSVLKMKKYKLF